MNSYAYKYEIETLCLTFTFIYFERKIRGMAKEKKQQLIAIHKGGPIRSLL